jgi:hypothetical protein
VKTRASVLLVLALALPAAAQGPRPETRPDPRAELRNLELFLSRAADRIARPSAFIMGDAACRGYRIEGVGAVFVIPPRAMRSRNVVVWRMPQMQAPRPPRDRRLQVVEQQAELLQRDAARQHAEVERAMDEVQRELARRIALAQAQGTPMPGPAPAAPTPAAAAVPAAPAAPVPPAPPEAPEAPEAPTTPTAIAPPPWALWFETDDEFEAEAPAETVVPRMRAAIVETLAAHGPELRGLRPDETIATAVEFVPSFPFGSGEPEKTLVIRIRKKDLDDVQSGRLSAEQLKARVESVEY